MSTATAEQHSFKSELKQVLHIITHSLYSHKEVFLRELISNASDAIDKMRFDSLNNQEMLEGNTEWKIKLIPNAGAGTLTVSDNGIGMSRDAIMDHLGTIAKSGTREFLDQLKSADAASRPELIGQFGVGFYSVFMVADKVTVESRMAGDPSQGVRWESDGQGEYSVEQISKPSRGTDVIIHLKDSEKEFLEEFRLRQMVKQFSDFIEHPVVMDVEQENDNKEKHLVEETLNSRKALWLRSRHDVTEDEYNAFYQQISGDFEKPAKIIHYTGEGVTEFKVLLFIPSHRPFEMQFGDMKVGPKLYIRRVLIMDHCEALLPPYLRFVKGVVDSADLPLNVSRELLQQNPLLEKIQKNVVKSVLKALGEMKTSEYDKYVTFFRALGDVLKEGLSRDWSNRELVADLLLVESTRTEPERYTTLAEYVERMPGSQNEIYYLIGEQRALIEHAPYLEVFRERGWEVLLLTDPIDEFVLPALAEYKGKKLKAADKSEIEEAGKSPTEENRKKFSNLFEAMKRTIDEVKEIRISSRLRESASCLVSEEGAIGAHMERLLRRAGHTEGIGDSKRILEVNPDHPAVLALKNLFENRPEDPRVESYTRLLYEQAVIAEGSKLKDPVGFAKRVNELLVKDAQA